MNVRRGYELDTLFWGRPVRPFHLAVTIATAVIAWTLLTTTPLQVWPHTAVHAVGALAGVGAVSLLVGWWWRSERFAEWGLLLATGVWASRAVYAALSGEGLLIVDQWPSVLLSLAWAVGAGGAYLLERYDHGTRGLSE